MKKYGIIILITIFAVVMVKTNLALAENLYTVKAGDTLWHIANRNSTTVEQLKLINHLQTDFLSINQQLILKEAANQPTTSNQATSGLEVAAHNEAEDLIPGLTSYSVQAGDNLWKISRQYGMTVDRLIAINNMDNDQIYPGQVLKVSVASTSTPSRAGSSVTAARVLETAAQYLGTPYRYGGQGPGGFDCSGFVKYVFSQFNINLPRTAASQAGTGVHVNRDNLLPGDLVFFAGGGSIDHVGIYTGNNQFIHSSSPRSGGVIYSSLSAGYYGRTYAGARRILN